MTEETNDDWFERVTFTWYQRFIIRCLCAGTLPKHIAFIMDGNRRFAKVKEITRSESYTMGFDKIGEILDYCETFGVRNVSVYAFSIENFKRSEEEKKELFTLMSEKMGYLLTKLDRLEEKGIRINVLGDISLFPDHISETLAKLQLRTKRNTEFNLNLCLAYTSRNEITHSVKCMAEGVLAGHIKLSDVNEGLLNSCLYSEDLPPVDLLIRTSGEVRLSDYMMWQANFAALQFVKVLWPDFGFWHFVGSILDFQRQATLLTSHRDNYAPFLARMTRAEQADAAHTEHCTLESHVDCEMNSELTQAYVRGSERRVERFVEGLREQRQGRLEQFAGIEVGS